MERGSVWRPNSVEMSPSCPRCGSSNTKFCYYNNYSLTQPRYFCKGCRRYWTKGGSLRNVPVGGGCRKSRRPKSSTNGNNGKNNLTSRYNNGVDSGGSNGGGGPNIDLALVYANFLNPKKQDNCKNDHQLPNGSDQNSVEFLVNTHNSSSLAMDPSSGEILLQVENPNCCPAWSTEIIDHHHHNYHYHHHHHPQMLFAGLEEINDKNQERVQEYCNYGLPPLPGEELVCVSHTEVISSNFVLSEPPLMENHIIAPAPVVQAPVVHIGDESDDPTNLLFGGWSPFDFSTVG